MAGDRSSLPVSVDGEDEVHLAVPAPYGSWWRARRWACSALSVLATCSGTAQASTASRRRPAASSAAGWGPGGGAVVGVAGDAALVEHEQDLGQSHRLLDLAGQFLDGDLAEMTVGVAEQRHLRDPQDGRRAGQFAGARLAQRVSGLAEGGTPRDPPLLVWSTQPHPTASGPPVPS